MGKHARQAPLRSHVVAAQPCSLVLHISSQSSSCSAALHLPASSSTASSRAASPALAAPFCVSLRASLPAVESTAAAGHGSRGHGAEVTGAAACSRRSKTCY